MGAAGSIDFISFFEVYIQIWIYPNFITKISKKVSKKVLTNIQISVIIKP
jgi:hypothetical protein